MCKKLFVSVPMSGRNEEDIRADIKAAKEHVERIYDEQMRLIDQIESLDPENDPVDMLGRSIRLMSTADIIYFCNGWEQSRGCRIENMIAREYDMTWIEK